MPWDLNDYPDSMKNMEPLLRKKAIEIANALEDEGYSDDRAIPIAHSQANEWYDNASEEEKKAFEDEPAPSKDDEHESTANPDLLDNDVKVFYEDDVWKVQTVGAERPDQTFDYKDDAIERGKDIAKNKESKLIIYKKDGDVQSTRKPN
jgi:uncharacterized protein YdaT